jgi:hypothetical protein
MTAFSEEAVIRMGSLSNKGFGMDASFRLSTTI